MAEYILNPKSIPHPATLANGRRALGFDIETIPTQNFDKAATYIGSAAIRMVQISNGGYEVYMWDMVTFGIHNLRTMLNKFCSENPDVVFVGQNIVAFDVPILKKSGFALTDNLLDTLVLERLINKGVFPYGGRSLGALYDRHLRFKVDKEIDHDIWREMELPEYALQYAANDVQGLIQLADTQLALCNPKAVETEMGVAPVLAGMSSRGMPLDTEVLNESFAEISRKARKARGVLAKLIGYNHFTAFSEEGKAPQQRELIALFDELGLEPPITAKTGKISLDKKAMSTFAASINSDTKRAVILRLLDANQDRTAAQKLRTYRKLTAGVGRLYYGFQSNGAATGRMAASNDNIQSVPRYYRSAFRAPEGYSFVVIDYAQIELRLGALVAQDKDLVRACLSGDVYTAIASNVYQTDKVTKVMRDATKILVLASQYGAGADSALKSAHNLRLWITRSEITKALNDFKKAYPVYWGFIDQVKSIASTINLKTTLPIGNGYERIIYPEAGWGSIKYTEMLNTPVQGQAAVLLKHALTEAYQKGMGDYLLVALHDEVVALVPEEGAEDYGRELARIMQNGAENLDINTDALGSVPLNKYITCEPVISKEWKH